jgi:hypothetical protein
MQMFNLFAVSILFAFFPFPFAKADLKLLN